ncbi:MAG: hypothetical protein AAGA42_21145 [Actinomycetota bacterium]
MTRPTRSRIARLAGGLVAACTAVTLVGSAGASAADEEHFASANPLQANICYTDNPLGEGYRVHVTTTNHSSRNARVTIDEFGGPVHHDQTLRPGETAALAHDVPLDRYRDYNYRGELAGVVDPAIGFNFVRANTTLPDHTDPCF